MKKFLFPATLAFLFLFSSCNFGIFKSTSEAGNIYVVLNNKTSRSISVNADNVIKYELELNGSSGYSKTRIITTDDFYNDDPLTFEEIPSGKFTLIGRAYSNSGYTTAYFSGQVKPLEDTVATLVFSPALKIDTKLLLPNIIRSYYSNEWNLSINNKASSVNSLNNPDSSLSILKPQLVTETIDGTVYFLSTDENDGLFLSTPDENTEIDFTYDEKNSLYLTSDMYTDSLWYFVKDYDAIKACKLDPNNKDKNSNKIEYSINKKFVDDLYTFSAAIANNLLVIAYNDKVLFYSLNQSGGFDINSSLSLQDLGYNYGCITDIYVPTEGTLYLLISQTGSLNEGENDFVYNNFNMSDYESKLYSSKGAFVELEYLLFNPDYYKVKRSTGYFNKEPETLMEIGKTALDPETKKFPNPSDPDNPSSVTDFYTATGKIMEKSIPELKVCIPNKAARSNYFMGPVKFVCIKPDELYIVDSGVSFRLADWTAASKDTRENGQKGRTSNIFTTDRLIKVDLTVPALGFEVVVEDKMAGTTSGSGEDVIAPSLFMDSTTVTRDIFGQEVVGSTQGISYSGVYPWNIGDEL